MKVLGSGYYNSKSEISVLACYNPLNYFKKVSETFLFIRVVLGQSTE